MFLWYSSRLSAVSAAIDVLVLSRISLSPLLCSEILEELDEFCCLLSLWSRPSTYFSTFYHFHLFRFGCTWPIDLGFFYWTLIKFEGKYRCIFLGKGSFLNIIRERPESVRNWWCKIRMWQNFPIQHLDSGFCQVWRVRVCVIVIHAWIASASLHRGWKTVRSTTHPH